MGSRAPQTNVCFLVHGVCGTAADFDTWVEVLKARFPDWILTPLKTLARGSMILGWGIDRLGTTAAEEALQALQELRRQDTAKQIVVHFVGHSMGGLTIRACLPKLVEELPRGVSFGHFMTLETPHLGGQAAHGASIWDTWRNTSVFSAKLSSQQVQLALQDQPLTCGSCGHHQSRTWTGLDLRFHMTCEKCGAHGRSSNWKLRADSMPFLVELADQSCGYQPMLEKFRKRTVVSLISKDGAVHPCAGLIRQHNVAAPDLDPQCQSFWGFAERTGTSPTGPFEKHVAARETNLAKTAPLNSARQSCWEGILRGFPGKGPRDLGPLTHSKSEQPPEKLRICGVNGCAHLQVWRVSACDIAGRMVCERCKARHYGWKLADPTAVRAARQDAAELMAWDTSGDGICYYPRRALQALDSLEWQRIPVFYHLRAHCFLTPIRRIRGRHDVMYNGHIFTLGQASSQVRSEHDMSRQCIECLAEVLAE